MASTRRSAWGASATSRSVAHPQRLARRCTWRQRDEYSASVSVLAMPVSISSSPSPYSGKYSGCSAPWAWDREVQAAVPRLAGNAAPCAGRARRGDADKLARRRRTRRKLDDAARRCIQRQAPALSFAEQARVGVSANAASGTQARPAEGARTFECEVQAAADVAALAQRPQHPERLGERGAALSRLGDRLTAPLPALHLAGGPRQTRRTVSSLRGAPPQYADWVVTVASDRPAL